jgi:hypothetical protein
VITEISKEELKEFLNKNHIQGHTPYYDRWVGAKHDGMLVGVLTAKKTGNKLEITRFATDSNIVVSGLFTKFMTYINRRDADVKIVISFSDNRHSSGELYSKTGFVKYGEVKPRYFYTKDYKTRENRRKYQKKRIQERFKVDISNKTEWQLMQELGYDRIWDAGKTKWELKL